MTTRDRLLLALKENKEQWISGEVLSRELGVSRTAVSKHMKILKQLGYDISSVTQKGYQLNGNSDVITPDEIKAGLDTMTIGQHQILCFKETGSTNTEAKRLADKGAEHGMVVIADHQLAGRGRLGRTWFSSRGSGIFLSMILRPRLSPMEVSRITLLTAVAVAETIIHQTGIHPTIKWPNDILVNGKKMAGILTELSTDMDAVNHVVVGIGLNVNTCSREFPKEVKGLATSVFVQTGKSWSRVELIQSFLKNFEALYLQMMDNNFTAVMKRWKELADIIGKKITINMINRTIQGTVMDVDADGVLILRDKKGMIHHVLSGDIIV